MFQKPFAIRDADSFSRVHCLLRDANSRIEDMVACICWSADFPASCPPEGVGMAFAFAGVLMAMPFAA